MQAEVQRYHFAMVRPDWFAMQSGTRRLFQRLNEEQTTGRLPWSNGPGWYFDHVADGFIGFDGEE
eukprot:15460741-Alexandrium_andersonii.AAC.1